MKSHFIPLLALTLLLITACGSHHKPTGWRAAEEVYIAIDETFRPILEEEMHTFSLLHPDVSFRPTYCSEDSALRLLALDSVRSCLSTRRLSARELAAVAANRLTARQAPIATDALALIVNPANSDTLLTLADLRGIVRGTITRWEQLEHATRRGALKLVFDASGSSTVRFMRDSLNAGRELSGNVFASAGGTNPSVVEMVRANPDLIGVVGADWLSPTRDSVLTSFDRLPFKVLKVSRRSGREAIGWRPYQYRIYSGDYPLVRTVYAISTDPRVRSNTKTFFFFLKGQKGQTVICNNSQMLPYLPVQNKAVSVAE